MGKEWYNILILLSDMQDDVCGKAFDRKNWLEDGNGRISNFWRNPR